MYNSSSDDEERSSSDNDEGCNKSTFTYSSEGGHPLIT
jgi:hypothetical protein